MFYHRFAHLRTLSVKEGQTIKKGQKIATMGGSGGWLSHLHWDVFKVKPYRWTNYVIGKSKQWVIDNYENPQRYFTMSIPSRFHHKGYWWLDKIPGGYHPGLDINGPGAGNADLGQKIFSPVDGVVEYDYSGSSSNGGWGRLIIIKEQSMDKKYQEFAERKGLDSWEKAVKAAYKYREGREDYKTELEKQKGEFKVEIAYREQKHQKQISGIIEEQNKYLAKIRDGRAYRWNKENLKFELVKTEPGILEKALDYIIGKFLV